MRILLGSTYVLKRMSDVVLKLVINDTLSEKIKSEKKLMGDLDPCILCGCIMHAETERRYKQLQYISSLVTHKCTVTSFVYEHITHLAKDERLSHISQNQNSTDTGVMCPCGVNGNATRELPITDVCMYGNRVPFCIACINWVRRLSKSKFKEPKKKKKATLNVESCLFPIQNIIPLDNLILFIHNPGSTSEPDKRAMCRLLQNICIQYTSATICVKNPYNRFVSPLMDCIVSEFKQKYFTSFNFESSSKHLWNKKR
jgi:hypothetical protein